MAWKSTVTKTIVTAVTVAIALLKIESKRALSKTKIEKSHLYEMAHFRGIDILCSGYVQFLFGNKKIKAQTERKIHRSRLIFVQLQIHIEPNSETHETFLFCLFPADNFFFITLFRWIGFFYTVSFSIPHQLGEKRMRGLKKSESMKTIKIFQRKHHCKCVLHHRNVVRKKSNH